MTQLLADRKGDLVELMKDGSLILDELQHRREAIHALLLNTAQPVQASSAGSSTTTRSRSARCCSDLHEFTQMLVKRQDQLQASIHDLGPYVSILRNIIGTGPGSTPTPRTWPIGTGEYSREVGDVTSFLDRAPRAQARWSSSAWPGWSSGRRPAPRAGGTGTRTVPATSAARSRIFPGSEVRILGVPVGRSPRSSRRGNDGPGRDGVRLRVQRAEADAQAVIITPTLTADRFVQLSPAYIPGRS